MNTSETAKRLSPLAVLLPLWGCATNPADVPLGGRWTGSPDFGSDGRGSAVWELRESEGVIAGTASLTFGALAVTGDVSGSYSHPDVRMTLVMTVGPGDEIESRWVGVRADDDMLSGVLHDADGGTTALDLTREEGGSTCLWVWVRPDGTTRKPVPCPPSGGRPPSLRPL